MMEERLTCRVCLGPYGITPAVQRWLSGSRSPGDPEDPHLCWVCKRLKVSAAAEAKEMEAL